MRSIDEVYGSLVYDGAPLLRVAICVSRALLVSQCNRSSDSSIDYFFVF